MIKGFIKKNFFLGFKMLVRLKIIKPKIIVRMDGGICSQMHQYLVGRIFSEKGYRVSYDLYWFRHFAKDNNGRYERNFDLLKAFPSLAFSASNRIESLIYMSFFGYYGNYFDHDDEDLFLYDFKPPKYLEGYYHSPIAVWTHLFRKYFKVNTTALDSQSFSFYEEIKKHGQSVGVHVRRGDLKDYHRAYGTPADSRYFYHAVTYLLDKIESPFFYFFSDDPLWVEKELIIQLPLTNADYRIVNINGSDKGYMDLFLIASCTHHITSKGSLGKYGALLTDSIDKTVILFNEPVEYVWKERLLNPIYL